MFCGGFALFPSLVPSRFIPSLSFAFGGTKRAVPVETNTAENSYHLLQPYQRTEIFMHQGRFTLVNPCAAWYNRLVSIAEPRQSNKYGEGFFGYHCRSEVAASGRFFRSPNLMQSLYHALNEK